MLRNKSAACLRNIKFPVKNYRGLRLSFGMGCICSKGAKDEDTVKKEKGSKKSSSNSSKDELEVENGGNEATTKLISTENSAKKSMGREEGDNKSTVFEQVGIPSVAQEGKPQICRVLSVRNGLDGAQVVAGWPSWLTSVAGEAIKGWIPRRADSFEKLDKIGQGTYSSVYRALDLETGKVVALKKVRFVNMDPESVRFMAREILILRRLDHPNVMKLEGLVTSRVSGNLYLVFEYMDHDLAGLRASPAVQFTESQIKCFMLQLFRGLEHCHNRGVLHRDIKGSNLLIDYHGNLKIGDFGLSTFFRAKQRQPLTSRVVTLWYRPPELLLGATDYGVAVDLWSSGCILAELFVGKPIMPGRTEVEQLHKIFKLCGSPSEEYWKNSKIVHSTIFKPQQPYKRTVAETFKDFPPSALSLLESLLAFEPELRGSTASAINSEFFTTKPLPCDPSSLPKYQPSKEYDVKAREEARRESKGKDSKGSKAIPTPDSNVELPASMQKWKGQSNPKIESSRVSMGPSGNSHSVLHSTVHRDFKTQRSFKQQATAARLSRFSNSVSGRGDSQLDFSRDSSVHSHWAHHNRRNVQMNDPTESSSNHLLGKPVSAYENTGPSPSVLTENNMGYALKKSRMNYSGPLLPPGGSVDDMLKEHEKQIQIAVRKARDKKSQQVGK